MTSQTTHRILIEEAHKHIGQHVMICGHVQTLRIQKKMQFVVLGDETGSLQIVHCRSEQTKETEKTVDSLTVGSAISITGVIKEAPQVKLGGIELALEKVEFVSLSKPLPITEESGAEQKTEYRFLDLRHEKPHLTLQVLDTFEQALRSFLKEHRFTEIHTPKLMGTASESGAEVFTVEYFDRKAYLAQSPQFYKQMAIASGYERVMEVGPVFRAEPSFTSRHATEFTGFDLEMAWIESHQDIMKMESEALTYAISKVKEKHGAQIKKVFGLDIPIPTLPFPQITLREAKEKLMSAGWKPSTQTADLDSAGEQKLAEIIKEEYGHEFVFVTDYPAEVRPFYHMKQPEDETLTRSFDLLWKGLEITTGAQREHRHEILCKQAEEKGLPLDSLHSYLQCFEYGMPPHGGFGIGISRLVMKLLDLSSIREASFLFRGPNRLTP